MVAPGIRNRYADLIADLHGSTFVAAVHLVHYMGGFGNVQPEEYAH